MEINSSPRTKAVTGFFVGVAAILFATLCQAEILTGRIVAVVDGDTVDLLVDEYEKVRIRISGIDAPEKAQPFGRRAKQKMSDFVFGKRADVLFGKRDRYGRAVGKVTVNGRDAGLALVDAGLAWHYKKYEKDQSASDRLSYAHAERNAKHYQVGLWGDNNPVAPWDWRKGIRK